MTRDRWDVVYGFFKSDQEMNRAMREEWHSKPRDSEEAIRDYYRESETWFINTFNHGLGALLALASGEPPTESTWRREFSSALSGSRKTVLDYGGGLLNDSWPLVAAGHRVEIAEVRGPVTDLLERFILIEGLEKKIGVVRVESDTPISGTYDGAVCFETLEHLLYPEKFSAHLHEHMKAGAPFVFSATFGAPEHAPYHVASNAHLGDEREWAKALSRAGFSPYWSDPNGDGKRIWKA
jgi:2-polyprenyl-3-methyl-5-hydroxy-6-metoxy-1,4-benzoquinol methylase